MTVDRLKEVAEAAAVDLSKKDLLEMVAAAAAAAADPTAATVAAEAATAAGKQYITFAEFAAVFSYAGLRVEKNGHVW